MGRHLTSREVAWIEGMAEPGKPAELLAAIGRACCLGQDDSDWLAALGLFELLHHAPQWAKAIARKHVHPVTGAGPGLAGRRDGRW